MATNERTMLLMMMWMGIGESELGGELGKETVPDFPPVFSRSLKSTGNHRFGEREIRDEVRLLMTTERVARLL